MSESDSFIQEVTEEVRRDRLFALFRRYGWIAVTLVVLLVGAAAFHEYRKAQADARAQAFGDTLMAAMEQDDPTSRAAALEQIKGTPEQMALVGMLRAGVAQESEAGDAVEDLRAVAEMDVSQAYRELAVLKLAMLPDSPLDPEARLSSLEPLTIPGAPYRLLALEQMAIAEVALGRDDAALERLQGILVEDRVSETLRRRVSQLIVALGGTVEEA